MDRLTKREKVALELAKSFTSNQGKIRMSLMSKVKFYLNIDGWRQDLDYNYQNISDESFKMADIFLKSSENKDTE